MSLERLSNRIECNHTALLEARTGIGVGGFVPVRAICGIPAGFWVDHVQECSGVDRQAYVCVFFNVS